MDNSRRLIAAMAAECKRLMETSGKSDPSLPFAMQPKHLQNMCAQIEANAASGSATKLHRWLGFIQCAMLANRMLDLNGLKAMFDQLKRSHAAPAKDWENLVDHLDPDSPFEIELGGEA